MTRFIFIMLLSLLPLMSQGAEYKRISNIDTNIFNVTSAGKLEVKTTATGMTLADLEVNGTITLQNDETISNSTNGTIQLLTPTIKHAYDSAAYCSITQADAGGVTFDSVSDGTASFTFSDPVSITGVITNKYDALAYWTATQADGAGVTFDSVSDGTAGFTFADNVTLSANKTLSIGTEQILAPVATDGKNVKRVCKATFTVSVGVNSGSGSYPLSGCVLPDNAIVTRTFVDVTTTFAGNGDDTSTIAITTGEAANDIVSAIAIKDGTNPWDAGLHEGVSTGTVANMKKMTAERTPAVVVAIAATDTALASGSMAIFIEYVVGN